MYWYSGMGRDEVVAFIQNFASLVTPPSFCTWGKAAPSAFAGISSSDRGGLSGEAQQRHVNGSMRLRGLLGTR